MIFKKIVGLAAALAAIAAAAAVVVVALAFALYAVARIYVGPAGAASVVAGAAALIALILALALTRKARPAKPHAGEPPNLLAKAIDLARDKPLVALGAAAAIAAVMVRNPKILGAIVAAALAPRSPPPKR